MVIKSIHQDYRLPVCDLVAICSCERSGSLWSTQLYTPKRRTLYSNHRESMKFKITIIWLCGPKLERFAMVRWPFAVIQRAVTMLGNHDIAQSLHTSDRRLVWRRKLTVSTPACLSRRKERSSVPRGFKSYLESKGVSLTSWWPGDRQHHCVYLINGTEYRQQTNNSKYKRSMWQLRLNTGLLYFN